MGALPVIADVFRVTFMWNSDHGVTARNVIHLKDLGSSRTEDQVGADFFTALASHWAVPLLSTQRLSGFNVIKLDGGSATIFHPVGSTGGEQSGEAIPQSAALIKFATGLRGPRHRGRMFLGPIAEVAQANGVLDATIGTALATSWTSTYNSLLTMVPGLPIVVASYKHADANIVAHVPIIEAYVGTQRRRMKQLRG